MKFYRYFSRCNYEKFEPGTDRGDLSLMINFDYHENSVQNALFENNLMKRSEIKNKIKIIHKPRW